MLLRSLLRYEADVSEGSLWMDPALPESWGPCIQLMQISVAPG